MSHLVRHLPFDQSGLGALPVATLPPPFALRVLGVCNLFHHEKVMLPLRKDEKVPDLLELLKNLGKAALKKKSATAI